MPTKNTVYLLIATTLVIIAGVFALLNFNFCANQIEKYANIFSIASVAISVLTFAFFVVTIRIQNETLQATKASLTISQNELIASRKEFKQQNRTLKYQRFDSTFFNQLTLYRSVVDSLPNGRGKLKQIEVLLTVNYLNKCDSYFDLRETYQNRTIIPTMQTIELSFGTQLSTFFFTFQNIIDTIFKYKKNNESRMQYLKTYFAQMGQSELSVAFIHYSLQHREPLHFKEYRSLLYNHISQATPELNKVINLIARHHDFPANERMI